MIILLFLFSQYFGQNKIQYRDFDFSILKGEHFEIYFYPGEEPLADFAEMTLEEAYEEYAALLNVQVDFKIPVIIYASPNEFAQTNVTLELIEESVGGFTEMFKNRVVVPFTGSYREFRHVLRHELVHVFQFQIFRRTSVSSILSTEIFQTIPLWIIEGMAEYLSVGWDTEADIYLKDLMLSEKLIPLSELGYYGGYIIYKEGQSFYEFIDRRYGRESIGKFIHRLKLKRSIEAAAKATFNIGFDELEREWHEDLKLRYWPDIAKKKEIRENLRRILDHNRDRSHYNTSTSISPNGDYIAYLSDRGGASHLIVISAIDGVTVKKLVSGERSPYFESLHLLKPGLSWSPDGKRIAFAARAKGHDVIYIIEFESGRILRKIEPDLQGVYSPCWSRDGGGIYFTGLKDGYSDIYYFELGSEELRRITDDIYDDESPIDTDSGLVFVSDRPDSGSYQPGAYALFIYTHGITRLTGRSGILQSPAYDPTHNGIYFVSDYDSTLDIYYYDLSEGRVTHRLDLLTGGYFPSVSSDGRRLTFSHLNGYGFDLVVVKNPLNRMERIDSVGQEREEVSYEFEGLDYDQVSRYRPHFTIDYVYGSIFYSNVLGLSGLTNFVISDILGNHRIYIGTDLSGSISLSNFTFNYWYLAKRVDFGGALFQLVNYYRYRDDLIIKRDRGIATVFSYPHTRFFRSDLYLVKIFTDEEWHEDFFPYYIKSSHPLHYRYQVFYPDLAFVYDDASWGMFAPNSGTRTRLELYATVPVKYFSDLEFQTGIFDYRRYFKLAPRSCLAFRTQMVRSQGRDLEYFSFGGPGSLRGYGFYQFTSDQFIINNLELRVPFLDHLKLAFPLPLEFRNIGGVLFLDNAFIWQDKKIKTHHFEDGWPVLDDVKLDFGFGFRARILFLIIGLDFGWPTDLKGVGSLHINLALGPDF
ncbi:hypothetical protein DRP53_02880 [candidate division WOR-3 bacterium]|uniref:Bacterial surface antigen (D15) domain-containing protein n=1 Tax=candidate division WOR-3 bacterium TaxID=2052148 RepID=A0A660SM55_UNCW3|nr:MAG: hypothetical protein DRP53_02880 [candidate division WOR-3 bacterium]